MSDFFIIACGWCRAIKAPNGLYTPAPPAGLPNDAQVSHGICPACAQKVFGTEANTCAPPTA